MTETESRKIRSSVVGCGKIGVARSDRLVATLGRDALPISHAECMITSDRYQLVGFCDAVGSLAENAASEYQVGEFFSDLAEMVECVQPDVVSVATRTAARPGIVKELVRLGVRGIYAEKPFSTSFGECLAAIQAVDESKSYIVLGTPRRHKDLFIEAFKLLEAGKVGDLVEVEIETAGASPLMWAIPHFVDLISWYCGDSQVEAIKGRCDFPDPVPLNENVLDCDPGVIEGQVTFKNGTAGRIFSGEKFVVRLKGSESDLEIHEPESLIRYRLSGQDYCEVIVKPFKSGPLRGFHDFAGSVLGHRDPLPSSIIVANQAVIMGIAHSALSGENAILVNEIPPDFQVTGRTGELLA